MTNFFTGKKYFSFQAHAQAPACQARARLCAQAHAQARAWARVPEQATRTLMGNSLGVHVCQVLGNYKH